MRSFAVETPERLTGSTLFPLRRVGWRVIEASVLPTMPVALEAGAIKGVPHGLGTSYRAAK